jgi:hypothetical protein
MLTLTLGLALASCANDKGAATTALATAQTAYAAVKDNAMKILPDQAKAIEDSLTAAKAALDGGDAKAALATAQAIPAQVKQLSDALPAKEAELKTTWESMSAGLPAMMAEVQKHADAITKSGHMPAGMDKAAFETLKTGITSASQTWTDAQAAFQSGNLADAVSKSELVQQALTAAMGALKIKMPAAPAAAAK